MDYSSKIRRTGFWICDKIFLSSEHRKKYEKSKETYLFGSDDNEIREKIEKILTHASNTTDFYKEYKGVTDIKQFPIVNKMNYINDWDKFVSSKFANDKKCHIECTSGSTGTPLEILYDQEKTRKRNATSIFLNSLGDYEIGDKQAYLRVWVGKIKKSWIQKVALNLVPVETSNIDDNHLREICQIIEKKGIKSIVGYASSITALSCYIRDNKYPFKKLQVKSITPTSESLSPYIRRELEKQFKCTVSSIYGAEEFGTIGIQVKGKNEYYIDTSGVYIEVLKLEQDIEAEDGELGRLVITDLYNHAFPIIRYENGDTVIKRIEVDSDTGRKRVYFTEIYGRKTDIIYTTDGRALSPHLVTNKMWGITNIKQWKFIQVDENKYKFLLNGDENKINTQYIEKLFIKELGPNAEITFEFVNEIPVLKSGKRKYIENLYRK